MPTYEYKCLACGKLFEYFQKMTDDPIEKCEECGGDLKKLIGAGMGPIFKGSGFYQTDYKNGSRNNGSKKVETKKEVTPTKTAAKKEKKAS